MVGRRGEAPLVPPYILCNFNLDGAVRDVGTELATQHGFDTHVTHFELRQMMESRD